MCNDLVTGRKDSQTDRVSRCDDVKLCFTAKSAIPEAICMFQVSGRAHPTVSHRLRQFGS